MRKAVINTGHAAMNAAGGGAVTVLPASLDRPVSEVAEEFGLPADAEVSSPPALAHLALAHPALAHLALAHLALARVRVRALHWHSPGLSSDTEGRFRSFARVSTFLSRLRALLSPFVSLRGGVACR